MALAQCQGRSCDSAGHRQGRAARPCSQFSCQFAGIYSYTWQHTGYSLAVAVDYRTLSITNKRAEMWGFMKEWCKAGCLPDDNELVADLKAVDTTLRTPSCSSARTT